jgi:hypothetical protein
MDEEDNDENNDEKDVLPEGIAEEAFRQMLFKAVGEKELKKLARLAGKDSRAAQLILYYTSQVEYARRIAELFGGKPDYTEANRVLAEIRKRMKQLGAQYPSEN